MTRKIKLLETENKDIQIKNMQMIQGMAKKIKNEYNPEKIILFGSYAWGTPRRDSDIDFFIIKNTKEKPRDSQARVREILDEENARFAIEPIIYTPKETKNRLELGDDFVRKILDKGVVVYG